MTNETLYLGCSIKSQKDKKGNAWKARAFRKSVVASEIHSGTTEESAILAVKTQLDKDRAHQIALRGPDGFPTAKEVGQALDMIWDEITAEQRLMLLAHFHEPDHIMTANQLAQAGLYESFPSANSQYGGLGRRLAETMNWRPRTRDDGATIWTEALATQASFGGSDESDLTEEGHWRWRLRAEVIEALRRKIS